MPTKTPYQDKPDRFNIFSNKDKTEERHPDMTGTVTLSVEVLKELVARAKQGKAPSLRVALWTKSGPKAGNYYSASLSIPKLKPQKADAEDLDDDLPF